MDPARNSGPRTALPDSASCRVAVGGLENRSGSAIRRTGSPRIHTTHMRRGDYTANNSCLADSTRSRSVRSRWICFCTFSTLWITVE